MKLHTSKFRPTYYVDHLTVANLHLPSISCLTTQYSVLNLWRKIKCILAKIWGHRGSNAGPLELQSTALPAELCPLCKRGIPSSRGPTVSQTSKLDGLSDTKLHFGVLSS